MSLKNKIKSLLPSPILQPLQKVHSKIGTYRRLKREAKLIATQPERHSKALEKVRAKKGPINVVFFALFDSVWKYDTLYELMEKDERFNPKILVCPVANYGRDNMLTNMEKCYNLFKSRGYNVIRAYDKQSDQYVDVRKELNPDIIFYTNPYKGLIDDRYYITNYTDILTCYTSYFFTNTPQKELTDTLLHNLVWKRYVENDYMVEDAKFNNRNHGVNCVNSGYPAFDRIIKNDIDIQPRWKLNGNKRKRIIWAPHHTITAYAAVYYSTFLIYYEYMFELAKKYEEDIQICFKPHPLLKNRLEIMWGEEKTKNYYSRWENLSNGMLNDGAYEDLFLSSDAIIHDSGSFIGEYLVTGKPAMFLSNEPSFKTRYNRMGQECLENYYIGKSKEDIEKFILDVIEGNDDMREQRQSFVKNHLLPSNGKLASENILDDLAKELFLK